MEIVSLVVALALVEYFAFSMLVGRARVKYGIEAPATSGHPIFERSMRVQQNTIELLVVFIPSMYVFAQFVSAGIAALLGLVFIVGRAVYCQSYVADPKKRSLGFGLSVVPVIVLMLGSLIGAGIATIWVR